MGTMPTCPPSSSIKRTGLVFICSLTRAFCWLILISFFMNLFCRLPSQYLYPYKRPELIGPEICPAPIQWFTEHFRPNHLKFLTRIKRWSHLLSKTHLLFFKKLELKDHVQTVSRQVKDLVSISFSNNSISSIRFITCCFFPDPLRRKVTVSLSSSSLPITAIKGIFDISASRMR